MSLTQTAIEILANLYGQSVAPGSYSADSPHTHAKGKTVVPQTRGRAKEEKPLGPIDIELKRQAKAALGRLHRRIARKMKSNNQDGNGKTMRVTRKNHKSGLGHDWHQDPDGTHVYRHHPNSSEAILQKIKRVQESLRALQKLKKLNEEIPAYGHEGRAARDAKIAFIAHRLSRRAMNRPTLPSWQGGKAIKQSYREGSITKAGRGLKPDQATGVRLTASGMVGTHNGPGDPDAWIHNHPKNGLVLSREKPEGADIVTPKPRTRTRTNRGRNRQPNAIVTAFKNLLGRSKSAGSFRVESYQNTPANREIGTDSLTDIYASETPGEGGKCKKCRCKKCICKHIQEIKEAKKKSRCWKGYKPTPGKKPYTKGSCQPIEEVKKEYQSPAGGLNAKGRAYFKRTEGSNLQAPVTGKVKPGSKAAKRRKSFCARSRGWNGERGRAARRRWKC